MRRFHFILFATAALYPLTGALDADALKFGPPPAWVHPQPIPPAKPTDAPLALLLSDEQIGLERGKIATYTEGAIKIENAQGLSASNLAFVWQPATDTVTVNKLQIRRGDKVIDVLASGQTFTVLRRETNLDAATLDGTLTATIQPEGVQEGDIIDFATTIERSDPVLKGHVEAMFGAWGGLPVESAHAVLSWPGDIHLQLRQTADLPAAQKSSSGGRTILEMSGKDVQPLVPPKGAPERFTIGRLAEASDFASWSDLARLFVPLFRDASAIPASGPLHDEIERIRAASPDPKVRAEQALALVQDRIRNVALEMGQGGYVPAPAETTWSRRFGDCKAKTVLLLGALHAFGISAEPVLVHSKVGDMIADRLPMIALFDHVLVRAHIGGKDYWLDGTRTGDVALDDIQVPNFGWGLPLTDNAQLVHMIPPPLTLPEVETRADIDASGGVYAAAPASVEQIMRGDAAVAAQNTLSSLSESQRQEFFSIYWKKMLSFISMTSASADFDKAKRELRLTMKGTAKLDWTAGYYHVANSTVGYDPDFDRPAGALHDAPFAVEYPAYSKTITKLHLPASFLAGRPLGSVDVHETLAGVEYVRTSTVTGDVLTVEIAQRSLVPEVPYKDALAASARLKALSDEDVALPLTARYEPTANDRAAIMSDKPASAYTYNLQAYVLLQQGRFDEAIADLTQALALDPRNADALANRGLARVLTRDFAQADKDLSAAQAIDPKNDVILRARALMAQMKGDRKTAVAEYTSALAQDPGNAFVLAQRAEMKKSLGDDEGALADSAAALAKLPHAIPLRVLRANILLNQGKRDAAAQEAELLTSQNPQSNLAFVAAGKIYSQLDMKPEAMKAFDRALEIKPQAFVYINRAEIRPRSDRSGRIADLDASLKLDPKNPDALADEAELLATGGDLKRALELYDRAAATAPDNSDLKVMRAVTLYKAGRTAEAESALAAFRKLAKTATDYNNMCWDKATAGILLDSALGDCREAVRLEPAAANIQDSLGFVLLRLGRLDESIAAYDKAVAKRHGSASMMGRALAYARKGDTAHAAQDRAAALKLDPDVEARFAEYGLKFEQGSATVQAAATKP